MALCLFVCSLFAVCFSEEICFDCFSYNLDVEEKREGGNWSDHKTLPLSEQGTLCVTGPNQVRIILLFFALCIVFENFFYLKWGLTDTAFLV